MSEVNLPALDHHETESKAPTPMQEINLALKACTFGRFHIRMLATSLIATISGVLVTIDTAFLLPIAECDLNMDLKQKGLLTAIPYFGMMFSSIIAGFLTDTFGRRNFIRAGKAGIFVLVLIAGSSQTYIVLLVAKLLQGTLWAVVFTPMITYTSEFCYPEIRDRVMIIHSTFVATSQMIITAISWGFLTNEWKYTFFDGYIVLNTWNFYLYAMSIFSLSAAILYSFLPESPKFLLSQGKYKEVREILIKMYVMNTRKEIETYPYINIWANKINAINESPEKNVEATFSKLIVAGLHNVKPLFKRPLVLYLTLLCTMNFCTMALYNLFRLWFPQLSTVVEHYSFGSDDGQRNLCDVLDDYTKDVREKIVNMTVSDVCVPTKSGTETYINNLIVASVCIAPSLISTLLVNKISKKFLLFTGGFAATCVTLGLRWVNYKIAVVILFAVAIAVTQFMMSLLQAYSVELFTTSVRALAVSFIMFVGRIGALTGNVTFPILLDIKCIIPFFTLATMMICTMVLSLLIPNKKKT